MNELSKHISTLLKVHGYAIIPGFGGFVLRHVPSSVSKDLRVIKAPSSEIGFNKGMTVNDGFLIQTYMVNSNLSYPAAERKVKTVVAEMNDCLYGKGELDLPEIGVLKMSVSGTVTFVAKHLSVVDARLYGLSDFEMPLLADIRKQQKKNEVVVAEKPVRKINLWNYAQYAAACVAVIVLYFSSSVSIDNSSLHRYDNMASMLPATIIFEPSGVENVMVLEDDCDEVKDVSVVKKKNEIKPQPVKEQVTASKEIKPVENSSKKIDTVKKYHIVVASLAPEDDADNAVAELKKEGYSEAMSIAGDNRVRIILKSFANFEEAVRESDLIRETTKFKDAWVLTKRI